MNYKKKRKPTNKNVTKWKPAKLSQITIVTNHNYQNSNEITEWTEIISMQLRSSLHKSNGCEKINQIKHVLLKRNKIKQNMKLEFW